MTLPAAPQPAPRAVPPELVPALDNLCDLLAGMLADEWRRAEAAGRVAPPRPESREA